MHYLSAPKPIILKHPATGAEVLYPVEKLFEEFVWPDARWRSNADWRIAFDVLAEKLEAFAFDGPEIAIEDAQHEKLAEVLRSIDFTRIPALALKLTRMCNGLLDAPTKPVTPPTKVAEAPAKAEDTMPLGDS